jgi:hypothetical protein
MPFILAILMICSFSMATVTIGKVDCPVQFEGRVEDIVEGTGTGSAFSTHTVVFKNLSTIKGQVAEQMSVEMLEHGPFEIERGKDYRIQLRAGNVCWIDKL